MKIIRNLAFTISISVWIIIGYLFCFGNCVVASLSLDLDLALCRFLYFQKRYFNTRNRQCCVCPVWSGLVGVAAAVSLKPPKRPQPVSRPALARFPSDSSHPSSPKEPLLLLLWTHCPPTMRNSRGPLNIWKISGLRKHSTSSGSRNGTEYSILQSPLCTGESRSYHPPPLQKNNLILQFKQTDGLVEEKWIPATMRWTTTLNKASVHVLHFSSCVIYGSPLLFGGGKTDKASFSSIIFLFLLSLSLSLLCSTGRGDQLALIYDSPVTNTVKRYTYKELYEQVRESCLSLFPSPIPKVITVCFLWTSKALILPSVIFSLSHTHTHTHTRTFAKALKLVISLSLSLSLSLLFHVLVCSYQMEIGDPVCRCAGWSTWCWKGRPCSYIYAHDTWRY